MGAADAALLTIVWATAAGLFAQVGAHRLRAPAIVPLLAIGVLLGPSGLGVVQPASLGSGLPVIVKLAVAVVLFDGALNLRLGHLRHAISEVRNLVTVGLLVTWIGASAAAWLIADLTFPVAVLLGAIVTVTGPTVVQPLLRRVHVPRRLKTVLEGEAILIDPVGAILAVVVAEIVLSLGGVRPVGLLSGAWAYAGRLAIGVAVGAMGGYVLSRLLRRAGLVPAELANLVALAGVWAVFGAAEWIETESGITAAVAMGLAFQRGAVPDERRLRRFKEQLTVLGVSIIFVLLAASLPLSLLREEGWRGFLTVMTLMVVVRPLSVAVSLRASTLTRGEKAFAAWVAPRGIIAASVASLFALEFAEAGLAEGPRLLALTFLTVALTVTLQGLSAAPLARLLGLDDLEPRQMVIVGAGPLGRALALAFGSRGRAVVLVDRNRLLVEEARGLGLAAIEGNALDEATLASARTEEAEALVALTANSEVNALAANLAKHAFGVHEAYAAIGHPGSEGIPDLVERVGGAIAFGQPIDVRDWEYRLEHGLARTEAREAPAAWVGLRVRDIPSQEGELAVARIRNGRVQITHPGLSWQSADEALVLRHGLGGESTLSVIPRTGAGPLPVTSG